MKENIPEMSQELFKIVSEIKGVKGVSESLSLLYVAEVDSEDDKENVEKVGEVLERQARKHGFELEVVAATSEELQVARDKLAEFAASGAAQA